MHCLHRLRVFVTVQVIFRYLLNADDFTTKQSKAKLPLSTPRRHPGGEEQLHSLIPPLDEGQLSTSRSDRMIPRNELNEQAAGLAPEPVWFFEEKNILPLPGHKSQTVQPVV
jgi:hypothetical protein